MLIFRPTFEVFRCYLESEALLVEPNCRFHLTFQNSDHGMNMIDVFMYYRRITVHRDGR